jgi:hypothetical protein
MKKICQILLLAFCILITGACQRGPTPEEIILSQVDLVANGDLEGISAIYADDIEYTMTGFPPEPMKLVGKEAVQGWISEQFASNMRIEVTVTSAEGNTVKTKTDFITDSLAEMGFEQLTCDEVFTFEDGLIKEWSCTLTEESVNMFMAAIAAMEAAAGPPKLAVTFDGENCLVEGPDSAPAGMVFFSFDNQSDGTAFVGVAKLDEGLTAEEVLAAIEPGSMEPPSGAYEYSATKGALAGKILDEYGIDFEPGVYTIVCVYQSSYESYPGAGLTISE